MAELEVKEQQVSQGGILPPVESVLENLNINPKEIKSIKPILKWTHYRAVLNWLIEYKPQPDATNLEQVRGYLEAFHHLCEVEDWERASLILQMRINTPTNEELHNQLGTWGYYREQINIYERVLDKVSLNENIIFLNGLGRAYSFAGMSGQGIAYYERSLATARELENQQAEGTILNNLGNVYYVKGDLKRAIDCYQRALEISRKIDDRQMEANALGNLGNLSNVKGNFEQAIEYLTEQLNIVNKIGDKQGEANALYWQYLQSPRSILQSN